MQQMIQSRSLIRIVNFVVQDGISNAVIRRFQTKLTGNILVPCRSAEILQPKGSIPFLPASAGFGGLKLCFLRFSQYRFDVGHDFHHSHTFDSGCRTLSRGAFEVLLIPDLRSPSDYAAADGIVFRKALP